MTGQTVKHLLVDHRNIRQLLGAFEQYLNQLSEDPSLDPHELKGLMDSLTEALLLKHEEKEETVLLPEISRHGISWSHGALTHVRREHRQGRYLLRTLRQAVYQRNEWGADDRRHFISIGREWVEFNRAHMLSEEAQLFPLVADRLSPEEDQILSDRLAEIDQDFEEMPDANSLRVAREAFVQKYGASQSGS